MHFLNYVCLTKNFIMVKKSIPIIFFVLIIASIVLSSSKLENTLLERLSYSLLILAGLYILKQTNHQPYND